MGGGASKPAASYSEDGGAAEAADASAARGNDEVGIVHASSRCTILLVQEQGAGRVAVVKDLEELGCSVRVAYTAHGALAVMTRQRFDCVFCSQDMPSTGAEGLEIARRMREYEAEHRPAAPPQQIHLLAGAEVGERGQARLKAEARGLVRSVLDAGTGAVKLCQVARNCAAAVCSSAVVNASPSAPVDILQMLALRKAHLEELSRMQGQHEEEQARVHDPLVNAFLHAKDTSFVIVDPSLPGNPMVHVSEVFCTVTGYRMDEVIGKHCGRLLQGKGTDPRAIQKIRRCLFWAEECRVCLLNYRKDGTPFYNKLFMAPLCKRGSFDTKLLVGLQQSVSKEEYDRFQETQFEDEEAGVNLPPSAGLSLSPPPASNGRRPSGTTPTAAAERRPSAGLSL